MKLRIALKIRKYADSGRYSEYQIDKALARYNKTKSGKDIVRVQKMLWELPKETKAAILVNWNMHSEAFKLLMEL